jgi:hypothetical protein
MQSNNPSIVDNTLMDKSSKQEMDPFEVEFVERILDHIKKYLEATQKFREDYKEVENITHLMKKLPKEQLTGDGDEFKARIDRIKIHIKKIGMDAKMIYSAETGSIEFVEFEKISSDIETLENDQFVSEFKLMMCCFYWRLQNKADSPNMTGSYVFLINSLSNLCLEEFVESFVTDVLNIIMSCGFSNLQKNNTDSCKEKVTKNTFTDLILDIIGEYVAKKSNNTLIEMNLMLEYCRFCYGIDSEVASWRIRKVQCDNNTISLAKFIYDEYCVRKSVYGKIDSIMNFLIESGKNNLTNKAIGEHLNESNPK